MKVKKVLSFLLVLTMLLGMLPGVSALQESRFVLVVESGGKLVIAPEYVSYAEGDTIRQALLKTNHDFVGLEDGWIMEIDGVGGNYSRSDQNGGYDLNTPASEITHFRFSEDLDSKPSTGLMTLMTAMADYAAKSADVRSAAKAEYDTAFSQFVGLDSASALLLAQELNAAVKRYEDALTGKHYGVTFTDAGTVCADMEITVQNPYGKVWTADQGALELPAGDYTIPAGITLLIPMNDGATIYTTQPNTVANTETSYAQPTEYRTLQMASGTNIAVEGAICVAGSQYAGGTGSVMGGVHGPVGFIKMASGSKIIVNSGANLYAWGYVMGSGEVEVLSGGTVYECFQVMDWRGGDNTSGMVGNGKRVFPMSQYYIQNIEVPMTLEAGAIEKGYMSVAISLIGIQGSAVPFIGSDGMFQINNGSIVKDYDENTGRLLIDVYGDISVKSLSISMKLGILGSSTINSKDYVLPINGNMTITMHSGSVTMTQDIALQPGARLIIGEGATCKLGSGNKIYVYDYDQWTTEVAADAVGEGPSFCGTGDATHVNLLYPDSAKNVQGRTEEYRCKASL